MSKNDITRDSIVTKQYSESYGKEQPKLDATVFVYRHKTTNRIHAHYVRNAINEAEAVIAKATGSV